MGFGQFYQIDNAAEARLQGLSAKGDWYIALGDLGIEDFPSLDAEESIPAWQQALSDLDSPIAIICSGDLAAEEDDSDDPNVIYLNSASTKNLYQELEKGGADYFAALLEAKDCRSDIWLFYPMLAFFKKAADNKQSAILLWGR